MPSRHPPGTGPLLLTPDLTSAVRTHAPARAGTRPRWIEEQLCSGASETIPTGSARTENGVPVTTDRGDLFVIAGDVVNPLPKGAAVGITLADHGVTLVGV